MATDKVGRIASTSDTRYSRVHRGFRTRVRPVWTDSPVGAESGCSRIGSADSYGYSRTYGHAATHTTHPRDGGGGDNGNRDRAAHGDADSDGHSYSHTDGYAYTDSNTDCYADGHTRHPRDGGGRDNGDGDRATHGDADSESNRDSDSHTDPNAYLYRNCNPHPNA